MIVLIALSFAPSAADAHAGHGHVPAVKVEMPDSPSAAQKAAEPKPAQAQIQIVKQASSDTPSKRKNCNGLCCGAACAACCVASLSDFSDAAPGWRSLFRLVFPSGPGWESRAPDSLKRPPKTFA